MLLHFVYYVFAPQFGDVAHGCSRPTTARLFYNILVLTTSKFVKVRQDDSYGPIQILAGENFS